MRLLFYLVLYSFLGFLLERLINLAYFGQWVDNSVLYGPYQPMYGLGVVMTLVFYNSIQNRPLPLGIKLFFLCIAAIIFTGLSEYVSGTLYAVFYDEVLWDYRLSFSVCRNPYVCIIPTSIFGLLSAFTVWMIHPFIEQSVQVLPKLLKWSIIGIFLLDVILTHYEVLL